MSRRLSRKRILPATAEKTVARSFRSIDRGESASVSADSLYTPETLPLSSLYRHLAELKSEDSALLGKYMDRAIALEGEMTPREQIQILHVLSRRSNIDLGNFFRSILKNLKKPSFMKSVSPMDLVIGLNSLAKLSPPQTPTQLVSSQVSLLGILARKIAAEIPSKIAFFEDHQLAQILHALVALPLPPVLRTALIQDTVVDELCSNRAGLVLFNPQSIVMISSALSRYPIPRVWSLILARAARIERAEMQPNWPDVLLSNFARTKLLTVDSEAFLTAMTREVAFQYSKKQISRTRVEKAATALLQLGAPGKLIASLRTF